MLEIYVVIIIQVVDTDNLVTGGQQTLADMKTNKTCGAGDQKVHKSLVNYAV